MHRSRTLLSAALLLAGVPMTGCLDHPLKEVQYESYSEAPNVLPVDPRRKVDILFVIDNSGSMGEEQAALAANFAAFVDVLEQEDVDADYRIGITTTDDGNPWCSGSGPETGALQLRSCRDHLDDFVFSAGTSNEVDRREEACLARCPEELADLQPLPSTTDEDSEARPRPWLERGAGGSNVPEGVSTAEAFACWGPQGINGCGYESPLEAMRKALVRSGRDDDDGHGFLREDALLQVVFITDEADCSLGPGGAAAFDPDGTRALWPDPGASQPPNAVCWNAGVSCETTADGFTHCEPVDVDSEGQVAAGDDEVLHPLSRYMEILDEIAEEKRAVQGDSQQVLVSVIAGVPPGYAGGSIDYAMGSDPAFSEDFGVGAGCSSPDGEAVPPVRLRALAEAFTDDAGSVNLFSICDDDYSPALEAIAEILVATLRPSCIDACVAGADALVEGDLPTCTVVREVDGVSLEVPTCRRESDGTWSRPEGEDLCVYAVTAEDLHPTCQESAANVELRFVRAPGADYGEVTATCEVSGVPRVDCPGRI